MSNSAFGAGLYGIGSQYYSRIYHDKDYTNEASVIANILQSRGMTSDGSLLDVACGTGDHIKALSKYYSNLSGCDISPAMIMLAGDNLEGIDVTLFLCSMEHSLRHPLVERSKYSAITCMFSAIGYVDEKGLISTCQNFADSFEPGGTVIINPWISPESFVEGSEHRNEYIDETIKIVRTSVSQLIPPHTGTTTPISQIVFNYDIEFYGEQKPTPFMVVDPDAKQPTHFTDTHILYLHSDHQYRTALELAGFVNIEFIKDSIGRGVWVATKS